MSTFTLDIDPFLSFINFPQKDRHLDSNHFVLEDKTVASFHSNSRIYKYSQKFSNSNYKRSFIFLYKKNPFAC